MPKAETKKTLKLPTVILRGSVAFPKFDINFDAARKKTVNALNFAMDNDQTVFLIAQKDVKDDDPTAEQIYNIGCVGKIKQMVKVGDNTLRVIVQCLYRAKLLNAFCNKLFWLSEIERYDITVTKNRPAFKEALSRKLLNTYSTYISLLASSPVPPPSISVKNDLDTLSYCIANALMAPNDDKQFVLEQNTDVQLGKVLLKLLNKENELQTLDNKINDTVKKQIDDNQKEYYLREQIKAINEELYGDPYSDDIGDYHLKIDNLSGPEYIKDKLNSEVLKLSKMPQNSPEATVARGYIDECLSLPFGIYTPINTDIKKSERILNRDFYGMEKVKERILELISVYILSPDVKGQIICLVGPPGVGKTSIAKTIAECMGRSFARISLGGIRDEAEIRGHRRTYIGSMPGKIITAVKQSKSNNSLILLDELDKLGADYKGDPAAALLEVLDGEQNNSFVDHYIDMPFDLSKNIFIATANTVDTIPAALLDRLEIIELSSYTREEKFNIAKHHIVAKELSNYKISSKQLKITNSAIYSIIDYYTREAGVRQLERIIASLCRKAAKKLVDGEISVTVTEKNIDKFLGKKKFLTEQQLKKDEVGIINGLAWTSVGGEIMQIEVAALEGTGKLVLTGSLGDVMQESAKAAVTFVRSRSEKFGIDREFYKNKDIHIHATEAAIPKDGPSAGVAMATALVSALSGKPIRKDIAMTGEITIRGRVLPIGGLKEKSMAAFRSKIKTVFIPFENIKDLEDINEKIRSEIEFIPVAHIDEILEKALV